MKDFIYRYIFGPVASRRLGRSLGIDIIPFKTCPYDCIYCQLGRTTNQTIERKEFVRCEEVIRELECKIEEGLKADYITFSGSGEPTLNSKIGDMISSIKKLTQIPVAVITNGSLLNRSEIREALAEADLVIPSLNAGSEEIFSSINRPSPKIRFDEMVEGLITFQKGFKNKTNLEVFLVNGVNTDEYEIERMRKIIKQINPDKIQLNTIARPPAEDSTCAVSLEMLEKIRERLGEKAEIIRRSGQEKASDVLGTKASEVDALLKRRPCTLEDISFGLNARMNDLIRYLEYLRKCGSVGEALQDGKVYYYWKERE